MTSTSYKINLSLWEACILERLMDLMHGIMLNQFDSPALFQSQLVNLETDLQELIAEFERDREADK